MVDKDWLKARIAEHKAAAEQAFAQANAHSGAAQAFERALAEIDKPKEDAAAEPNADR